ncbi:MAG: VWA domain-containing protein, partial [Planctomycetota bacterium]|nr:VWA domain-containing protein [Planctomycetota bacterium]
MVQRETDRWGWLHAGTALLLACLVPMPSGGVAISADTPAGAAPVSATISFVESAAEQPQGSIDSGEPQMLQVTAVGLRAEAAEAELLPCDILVLVDTSASQAGAYLSAAHDTVSELLALMSPNDRVRLVAIDVTCEPLSDSFAAAKAAQTTEAVARLESRTPLGSTDIVRGLDAASQLFDESANRARRIIYIGDGPGLTGTAPLPFKAMLGRLRMEKVAFHAVATGPMVNWPCLAAIANATGGMVVMPTASDTAADTAQAVARSLSEPVFWTSDSFVASTAPAAEEPANAEDLDATRQSP